MSKDHITQERNLPELQESTSQEGVQQEKDGGDDDDNKQLDPLEVVVLQVANDDDEDEEEGCRTPTSSDHKIPTVRSCPPTPRKKVQSLFLHKRKLPELDFFEAANKEEVESFFRSSFELSRAEPSRPMKRRCISY